MARASARALLFALAACGDNAAPLLPPSHDLVVVAHQDDDMLFIQPDLFTLVSAREPVTVVYVTAGDAGEGLAFAASRKRAVQNAYATVSGFASWSCDAVTIADHAAERCMLADRPVTLVFLGYPDGGVVGELPGSLLQLWEGSIERATTVAEVPTTYDRDGLIRVVASIIDHTRPAIIRTLEIAGTHGDDHSDHMIVGALTQLALAASGHDAALLAYRGYNINYEPPNIADDVYQQASLFMRAYLACLGVCGECGVSPCETLPDTRYEAFLHRRYVVSMRDAPVAGVLRSDIVLEAGGLLRRGNSCLQVEDDGSIAPGECTPAANRFFQLDSEGHVWSGVPPAPVPNMLYDHTTCVVDEDGVLAARLCGEHRDWTW